MIQNMSMTFSFMDIFFLSLHKTKNRKNETYQKFLYYCTH